MALLRASVIAAALREVFGAQWTFLAGAGFAAVAAMLLLPLSPRLEERPARR